MEVSHTTSRSTTLSEQHANLRRRFRRLQRKLAHTREQLHRAELEIARKQSEVEFLNQQSEHADDVSQPPNSYFRDPNIFGHEFAASMVALCVNLANVMPFRAVSKSLRIVLDALGISAGLPDRETIVRWCKRLGLDRLQQNQCSERWKNQNDVIWIVDHSNQIGTQKALVILAISASDLPPPGETLSLDALEVLVIEPGESWTRDDMRRVYRELAGQVGRPRFVLCDGAVELRESVDVLCDTDQRVDVLRDFKHVAANRFESMIGRSDEFRQFQAAMGKTRCRIQQTDLAHLNPPALKTKSRFMNIAPIIAWAEMVLGVLDHPNADPSIDAEKLQDRLGWLRDYRQQIGSWKRCCEIIGHSLAWINRQGLERSSGEQLHRHLEELREGRCEQSDRMLGELVEFVRSSAGQLEDGERGWLSSESLESVFGLFKRREGQQSRSGFTGLIVSIPTLLRSWSATEVRVALQRTSMKDLSAWVVEKVGPTLWSRRTQAFTRFGAQKCKGLATL